MNTKKLNLDLALQLVNKKVEPISLLDFQQFMKNVKEAGEFINTSLKEKRIGKDWLNSSFSLQYENCTVNVDFIENEISKQPVLKSFRII
ncbi:MAG: hypothetical protein R2879_18845 [Saprospiraceae bacterium]